MSRVVESTDHHGTYFYVSCGLGTPYDGYWLDRADAERSIGLDPDDPSYPRPDGPLSVFGERIDKWEFETDSGQVGTVREPTLRAVQAVCPANSATIRPGRRQVWALRMYSPWDSDVMECEDRGFFVLFGPPDLQDVERLVKVNLDQLRVVYMNDPEVVYITSPSGVPIADLYRVED